MTHSVTRQQTEAVALPAFIAARNQKAAGTSDFAQALRSASSQAELSPTATSHVSSTIAIATTAIANSMETEEAEKETKAGDTTAGGTSTTTTGATTSTTTSTTASTTASTTESTTATTSTASTASTGETTTATSSSGTGLQALVSAILDGSLNVSYVTNPAQLQETTPVSTDTMPNFYYASDQTAQQIASLLGGTVVQQTPFGQDVGWTEPLANFIQLPNGQTVNAADIAYYGRCAQSGASQLTADLTATINESAAWSNYYQSGGQMPSFPMYYVGPPISGMTYPAGMVGADGNVINPAAPSTSTYTTSTTQGT